MSAFPKLSKAVAALALIGTMGAGAYSYQVATATSADAVPRIVKRYCKRDYRRLCPRYRAGSSRMRACMRAKRNYLSPLCKKALIDSGYAR
ncbi:MAG: hypothetical protein AAFV26_02620 [Pseudomonadota bacterium]